MDIGEKVIADNVVSNETFKNIDEVQENVQAIVNINQNAI